MTDGVTSLHFDTCAHTRTHIKNLGVFPSHGLVFTITDPSGLKCALESVLLTQGRKCDVLTVCKLGNSHTVV